MAVGNTQQLEEHRSGKQETLPWYEPRDHCIENLKTPTVESDFLPMIICLMFVFRCFGSEACIGNVATLQFNISDHVEGVMNIIHDTTSQYIYTNSSIPLNCDPETLEKYYLCWEVLRKTLRLYISSVSKADAGAYILEYNSNSSGKSERVKLTLKDCNLKNPTTLPTDSPNIPSTAAPDHRHGQYEVLIPTVIVVIVVAVGFLYYRRRVRRQNPQNQTGPETHPLQNLNGEHPGNSAAQGIQPQE
ncbi:uncharacterized protein LOC136764808 isoform X2 [Amia ocellicauda]|uniref:uncharacterized protein LOC136764808 isoform X2 n=1 Tax=Amia ocellicauda TaxID=2972642 RepID=UPI0034649A7B